MKYRCRLDIAATLLKTAAGGEQTKTRLMYAAFLAFEQVEEYLNFLMSNGLLSESKNPRRYSCTEKGLRFLRKYEELSALLST